MREAIKGPGDDVPSQGFGDEIPIIPHARSAANSKNRREAEGDNDGSDMLRQNESKTRKTLSDFTGISIVASGSAEILGYGRFAHGLRWAAAQTCLRDFYLLARRSSVRAALTAHRAVIHSCPSSEKPNPQTPFCPSRRFKPCSAPGRGACRLPPVYPRRARAQAYSARSQRRHARPSRR